MLKYGTRAELKKSVVPLAVGFGVIGTITSVIMAPFTSITSIKGQEY